MLPDRLSGLLTAYVDGELDRQQRKAVLRLLRRSPEARELLRHLQQDADQLRGLPRQSLGQDFPQQVLQVIASRKAESARRSALTVRSYVPAWLGLATAAAVLLVVGFGSYVYFVAANRQKHAELLAVRTTEPDRSSPEHESLVPEVAAPSPLERSAPEILGPPAAETAAKLSSSPAVAPTEDGKPQAAPSRTALAAPIRHHPKPLKDPERRFELIFNLRDGDQEKQKQQLLQELQKGAAHRMDLCCTDTRSGIERLRAALKSQAIHLVIDPDARAILELRMGTDPEFALYLEEVTAEEMITLLQQLSGENRKGETKRRSADPFESLIVKAMTREDEQKLPRLLGIDSSQWDAPKPKGQPGVDIRKPLSANTEEQGIESLKGRGAPRSEAVKPAVKTLDRQALVVAYTPSRPRPTSAELKEFLDRRRKHRAGTVQILLVLRSVVRSP